MNTAVTLDVFVSLNNQIQLELQAWYAYLAMSNWCAERHFHGYAKWLNAQAQEEYTHAMKLRRFLLDRGAEVTLQSIDQPCEEFDEVVDIFESALKQEQENTQSIHNIFQQAFEQRAFACLTELQWFIQEQVEEENTARTNLAHIEMVKDDPAALLDLDQSFGERSTLLPPAE